MLGIEYLYIEMSIPMSLQHFPPKKRVRNLVNFYELQAGLWKFWFELEFRIFSNLGIEFFWIRNFPNVFLFIVLDSNFSHIFGFGSKSSRFAKCNKINE